MKHQCYCGIEYECEYCNTPNSFICPTLNEDEEANLCPSCLDRETKLMEEFYNSEEK